MKLFGLIGYPLSHSFSKAWFEQKFREKHIIDSSYQLFPIENITLLPSLIKANPQLRGLNVTIPYKKEIIRYLDRLDPVAKEVGAVNTVKIEPTAEGSFQLTGYNTDIYGFSKTFKHLLKPYHKKALILGSGGASKAVAFVLKQLKVEYIFVSRKGKDQNQISYQDLNKNIIDSHLIIINTTPVGMFPLTEKYPDIPYEFISGKHLFYDLIYNPEETLFLKKGKEKNIIVQNGLRMLQLQADKAWEIWNNE